MKKLLQITFIILVILLVLAPNFVKATGVNMNLTPDTTSIVAPNNNTNTTNNTVTNTLASDENVLSNESENTSTQEPNTEPETTTDTLTPSSTNNSNSSATVSSLNQLPEAGLGLNNIINIILIVVGVLLILLGIAILIRIKQ